MIENIVPIADAPEQTCRGCDWFQRSIIPDHGYCTLHELRGRVTDPACGGFWAPGEDEI